MDRLIMNELIITKERIDEFRNYLRLEEKSENTIEKYMRDIKAFWQYAGTQVITKELAIAYKENLLSNEYAVRSVNSMIASLNSFFTFAGCEYLKIKTIKEQRQIFCSEEKELTREEYNRLLSAAESKGNKRLNLILQTICGTGIRVSELKFITVEAVKKGEAFVFCKGKRRSVFNVKALQKKLLRFATEQKIESGCIFVTRTAVRECLNINTQKTKTAQYIKSDDGCIGWFFNLNGQEVPHLKRRCVVCHTVFISSVLLINNLRSNNSFFCQIHFVCFKVILFQ